MIAREFLRLFSKTFWENIGRFLPRQRCYSVSKRTGGEEKDVKLMKKVRFISECWSRQESCPKNIFVMGPKFYCVQMLGTDEVTRWASSDGHKIEFY